MINASQSSSSVYCGRFAPSPSGPLHLGSLVTALGSWLDARAQAGQWRLRIEDIDPPRSVAGAVSEQLQALEDFGLHWDGAIVWQSQRSEVYQAALERLHEQVFWCTCTRAQLQATAPDYPGTCYARTQPPKAAAAARLRGEPNRGFHDRAQGWCSVSDAGQDPVLKRRDGLWAYALAVVVDDAEMGITDVVRGADLISSTPIQIMLQQALDLPTPRYLHLPLITSDDGRKLSKQNHAEPLDRAQHARLLRMAMLALGLTPPPDIAPQELLSWAIQQWPQRTQPPLEVSVRALTHTEVMS